MPEKWVEIHLNHQLAPIKRQRQINLYLFRKMRNLNEEGKFPGFPFTNLPTKVLFLILVHPVRLNVENLMMK